jgi:putative ABC transport system permease protein
MDTVMQDVRYGCRQLLMQRGSSIVAIVTLALGIGAATAIFSVIDATMLRPLPYPNPEELVSVGIEELRPDGTVSRPTTAMEDMRFWQEATDVFSQVAGWGSAFGGRIADGAEPERVTVLQFTEDYLSMHGVTPTIGRDFTREDTDDASPLVALLGYGYWQSRFGGRPDVIGETVRLDDDVATVVGVLPASFNAETPIATPLRTPSTEYGRRGTGRVSVYARLQPGLTPEMAAERLAPRMENHVLSGGGARPSAGPASARISSRLESALSSARTTVNVLAGAVGLILLIACVNVAGVLLARGAVRQSELAVRASMGASRLRLVRQMLTEAGVIAIAGAALGVLLAWLSLDAIVANIPLSIPSNSPVTLNGSVLVATVVLLIPTVLIFGLVPALRLSRVKLGSVLARGGRQQSGSLSRRGGQLLIGAEVALAVVLVAGAGLMIRSFVRIADVDLGFTTAGLLTMQVLPLDQTPGVHEQYYQALLQRVKMLPGVESAGVVDNFSLGGGGRFSSLTADGTSTFTSLFRVLPGYFETIGAHLVTGRWPTDADVASGLKTAVLNESAARAMFPDGGAIGRDLTSAGSTPTTYTVIGIVKDIRHGGPLSRIDAMRSSQVFLPMEITPSDVTRPMTVVMKLTGSAPNLAASLRQAATEVGPRALVERIRTSEELFGSAVITPKRRTVLLGLLGALGLALAVVGVFGMTAYSVARRTREIGVRMAFGARPGQVVRTMIGDAAWPVVLGTLVGVGGAVLATKVIEGFLFETSPTDPVTLAAVAVTLVTAGCLAALAPALRAARVDPASSLRTE